MFKNFVFIYALVCGVVFCEILDENSEIESNFVFFDSIDEAKEFFAESDVEITQLSAFAGEKGQILYTLGNRVSGDRVVATGSDSASWTSAQNIQLSLGYPRSGSGAVVTYVQVLVNQNSNSGRGYVISGGIGQRQIGLVIEANSVTQFSYSAQIYGRD